MEAAKRASNNQKTARESTNQPASRTHPPCQSVSRITELTENDHVVQKQPSPRGARVRTQLQACDNSNDDSIMLPDLETWKAIFEKLKLVSEGSLPKNSLNPLEAGLLSDLLAHADRKQKRQREDSPTGQEEKRECNRISPRTFEPPRTASLPAACQQESQQSSPQQPPETTNRKKDQKTTIENHNCTNQPTPSANQPAINRKNDAFFRNRRTLRRSILKATAKVDELAKLELRASTSFMESKKPVFQCLELQHPLNFLEMLNVHLKRVHKEDQVNTAYDCFQDVDWAGVSREYWSDIEDFKYDFIFKYWGRTSQNALRKEIVSGSYSDEDGSMARYFINLVSQARWLQNKIPDDELISDIMNHFPKQVQVGWYASLKRTVLEAVEFLRKMDEIEMLSDLKEGKTQRNFVRCKYKMRVRDNAPNDNNTRTSGN